MRLSTLWAVVITAILAFALTVNADDGSERIPSRQAARDSGARIYAGVCAACHQLSGAGLGDTVPPLAGSDWVTGSQERLIRILLQGLTGEIEVSGEMFNAAMPPWGTILKDFDIAAVATYTRTSWGNKATAIAESTVTRIRAATADRTKPWTQDELRRIVR